MSRVLSSFVFLLLALGMVGVVGMAQPADPLVALDCDDAPEGFACASVRGGTLTNDMIAAPSTLNPVLVQDTASGEVVDHMFGSGSFTFYNALALGAQGTVPQVASTVEVNEDATSVSYTIREGLSYSDGSPVTAEDILYWYYNVVWNPNLPNSFQSSYVCTDGTPYVITSSASNQVTVSCPEPFRTFTGNAGGVFAMSKQMALDLIDAQGIDTQTIVSAGPNGLLDTEPAGDDEVVGASISVGENGELETSPAGDDVEISVAMSDFLGLGAPIDQFRGLGPFQLESFDSQALARYARNPEFFEVDSNGTQLPYLDEYQLIIIPTQGQNLSLSNFLNGTTDKYGPRPQDIAVILSQAASGGFNVNQGINTGQATTGTTFASVNFNDPDPNLAAAARTREVRKALSLAIDRGALVNNVLLGIGTPQYGPNSMANGTFFIGRDNTCDDFIGAGLATADTCQNGTWTLDNGAELNISFLPSPTDPNYQQHLSCLNDYESCLATARELLDSVGVTDSNGDGVRDIPANLDAVIGNPGGSFETQVVTNTGNTIREEYAQIVCNGWSQLGISCNAASTSFATLVQQLLGGTYTGSIVIGLTGNDPAGGVNVFQCGAPLMLAMPTCDPAAPADDANAPIEGLTVVEDGFLQGFNAVTVEGAQEGFDQHQTAWGEHELWFMLSQQNALFAERIDRVSNTGGFARAQNGDVQFRCDLPGQTPNCANAPHQP